MLAENIRWINFARNKIVTNNLSCNSFSHMMKGQCNMPLVNFRMRSHRTIDYEAVVSKHETLSPDRDAKVVKSRPKIYYLLGSYFNSSLFVRVPINRSLVYKVSYPCHRPTSNNIVKQINIIVANSNDMLSK